MDFKILTWNICGIEDFMLSERISNITKIIIQTSAEIVMLQEVTERVLEMFSQQFKDNGYQIFYKKFDNYYFNIILVNIAYFTILHTEYSILSEDEEDNGKMLTNVNSILDKLNINVNFMTSHLDSGVDCNIHRIKQLNIIFNEIHELIEDNKKDEGKLIIFGGDLNIISNEFENIDTNLKENNIVDLWDLYENNEKYKHISDEIKENNKYTWDPINNIIIKDHYKSNKYYNKYSNNKKKRLDRFYCYKDNIDFDINSIELIGNHKDIITSDHFGLLLNIKIDIQ